MNIFGKFCCFFLLPYWKSTVFSMQEMAGSPQEFAELPQDIAEASSGELDIQDELDLIFVLWFDQKLDHFSSTETGTWKQRYYVNLRYYNGNGPIFLIIGGLVEIFESDIRYGAWIEYAKEMSAKIFYLEHRFYGLSYPKTDLNTENLVYLNSEQALADLAWFIASTPGNFQENIPSKTIWIAFGVTFGGTLAARLRLKYPHLIYAAVTSSSLFYEVVSFREYFKFIESELDKHPGVKDKIKEAFQMIQTEIDKNKILELAEKFNVCPFQETHNSDKNINYFFWNLSNTLALIMQYECLEVAELRKDVMNILVNESELNALDRLASAVKKILEFYRAKCLSIDYDEAILAYKETSLTAELPMDFTLIGALGNRQNLYQRCTEFGQFETSDQNNSLFTHYFPEEFYIGICTDVFGTEFDLHRLTEGIHRTNLFYGGLDIEVSRVLFVNGILDPWSILDASYCTDLISGYEVPELSGTRQLIVDILLQWLWRLSLQHIST